MCLITKEEEEINGSSTCMLSLLDSGPSTGDIATLFLEYIIVLGLKAAEIWLILVQLLLYFLLEKGIIGKTL